MKFRRKPAAASPVEAAAAQPVVADVNHAVGEATRLEAELAGARTDLAAAKTDLRDAREAYDRATDTAALAQAMQARSQIAEAEVTVDIGRRLVERLEVALASQLDGLTSAQELADRERLRMEAEKALQGYERTFRNTMPAVAAELRKLVRLWAEAELAREAAAAAGVQLPRADAFRDQAGSPRIEVSRRERDLWINPWCDAPFGDRDQEKIRRQSDGSGVLSGETHATVAERKRRYAEVEFYAAMPGRIAPTLAEDLVLPPAFAGDSAGWTKPDGRSGFSPRAVLAQLQASEASAATPPPVAELRKELKPLEPARSVKTPSPPRRVSMSRSG